MMSILTENPGTSNVGFVDVKHREAKKKRKNERKKSSPALRRGLFLFYFFVDPPKIKVGGDARFWTTLEPQIS